MPAGFAPVLLLVLFGSPAGHSTSAGFASLALGYAVAGLPRIMAEEAMYRGLSWMLLKRLGVRDILAFSIQALVFWLSHANYWRDPVMFWFWLPWTAIWFGLIVWGSWSLAMSTFAHFVLNLSVVFLRL